MGEFGIKIMTGNDSFHTSELGLKMTAFNIPQPAPKTNYIDVPHASVSLDLTEALGGISYENRENVTFTFVVRDSFEQWAVVIQRLAARIHGKKCKVIVDNDLSHYYLCRLEIDPVKSKRTVGTITISGRADAYKYDLFSSDEEWEWDPFDFETGVIRDMIDVQITNTSNTLTITGSTKEQTPVFIVKETNKLSFTYKNRIYDLSKTGEYRFPALKVGEKDVVLTFTGTGILSVRFRGAYL